MVKCWYAEGLSKNNGDIQVQEQGLGAPEHCFIVYHYVIVPQRQPTRAGRVSIFYKGKP